MRVGEMNGKWALLFRIGLAIIPFGIGWCVYITNSLYNIHQDMHTAHKSYEVWMARTEGNRFTQEDWNQKHELLMNKIPPQWVTNYLERLETEQLRLQLQIDRLEGHETGD